jgi:acetyltransferase EpsM
MQIKPKKKELIIIGGGEQAKVVFDAVKESYEVLGYIDKMPSRIDIQYLGPDKDIHILIKKFPSAKLVWGIGSNHLRAKLYNIYGLNESRYETIIHSSAIIADSAILEAGVFAAAGTIIQPDTVVRKHSIINTGSIIEHNCEIGEYSHIASGVVIGGGCSIGSKDFIGLGSCIKDHITIGDNVIVGSGSVVINNVQPNEIVAGVPVKIITSQKRKYV